MVEQNFADLGAYKIFAQKELATHETRKAVLAQVVNTSVNYIAVSIQHNSTITVVDYLHFGVELIAENCFLEILFAVKSWKLN